VHKIPKEYINHYTLTNYQTINILDNFEKIKYFLIFENFNDASQYSLKWGMFSYLNIYFYIHKINSIILIISIIIFWIICCCFCCCSVSIIVISFVIYDFKKKKKKLNGFKNNNYYIFKKKIKKKCIFRIICLIQLIIFLKNFQM
jgi:hypothetical protein